MTLPRSTEQILNELRIQFLRSTEINATEEEEHRHRRLIGPFIPDPDDYDEEDEDIRYLLSRVESPPIPINVLEDSELVRRLKSEQGVQPKIFQNAGIQGATTDNNLTISLEQVEIPIVNTKEGEGEGEIETLTHSLKTHHAHEELRQGDVSSGKTGSLVTLRLNSSVLDSSDVSFDSQKTTTSKPSQNKIPLLTAATTQKLVPNFTKLFKGTYSENVKKRNSTRRSSRSSITTIDDNDNNYSIGYDDDESDDDDDDDDSELYGEEDTTGGEISNYASDLDERDTQSTEEAHRENPNDIVIAQTYHEPGNSTILSASQSYYNDDSKYLLFEDGDSSKDEESDDDLLLDSDLSESESGIGHVSIDIKNTFDDSYHIILENSNLSKSLGLASSFVRSTFVRDVDEEGNIRSVVRNPGGRNKRRLKGFESYADGQPSEEANVDINNESTFQIIKQDIAEPNTAKSSLSNLINVTLKTSSNPLVHFSFVNGENIGDSSQTLKLIVHIPPKKLTNTVEFIIRRDVTVFETIGYITLKLSETKPEMFKEEDWKNPNYWSLSMFDEDDYENSDDEPDDAFGLLDRLKTIGSYGIDEVAFNKVDGGEFRKNDLRTPAPKHEEPYGSSQEQVSSGNSNNSNNSNGYHYSNMLNANSSQAITSQYDHDDTMIVELHVSDYENFSSEITFKLQMANKIQDVLDKYCQQKHVIPCDYNLKLKHEKKYYLNLKDTISSLDGFHSIQALTKIKTEELGLTEKPIDPSQNQLPTLTANHTLQTLKLYDNSQDTLPSPQPSQDQYNRFQQPSQGQRLRNFSNSLSMNKLRKPPHLIPSLQSNTSTGNELNSLNPNAGPANEYHKYKVWRRLPMSFINRHERTFAIDGEYVYILPSDSKIKNFQDSKSGHNLKTINFHISQLMNCKISKKISQNFKIVIQKAGGLKRYDFEAGSSAEALEIVNRLKGVLASYKINVSGAK